MMGADHALEIDCVLRHARFAVQIAIIDRQRKVAERNAGDFHAGLDELIGCRRGKPHIERAGAKRAGDHEDFQRWHDLDRIQANLPRGPRRTVQRLR